MTNMAAMPIYDKNLKKKLLLQRLFKLPPLVDLDRFYAKVKFGDIGLCIGKSDFFLETVAALGLKVA